MDKVKTSVVGVGGWGTNILRALSQIDQAEVRLVCDINHERTKMLSKVYPAISFTNDPKDVEKNKEIDAVIIATPSPTHKALAERFLLSGRSVFVEKPMALTLRDAERLLEITQKNRSHLLMVGHLLIYHPAINTVEKLVKGKEIGDILYMYTKRLNLGIVRNDENVIWSLAPHDISIILNLIGEEPEAVSAQGSSYLTENIQDVAFITIFFPGGKIAQIHVSWLDPHKERKVVVVGSKKMVVFDDMETTEKVKVYDKGVEVTGSADFVQSISIRHGDINIPLVPAKEPLIEEMRHFITCVMDNIPPLSGAKQGLDVVKVLTAGDRSIRSGGKIIPLK